MRRFKWYDGHEALTVDGLLDGEDTYIVEFTPVTGGFVSSRTILAGVSGTDHGQALKMPLPPIKIDSELLLLLCSSSASMIYASAGRLSAKVPYSVAGSATVMVQAEYNRVKSDPIHVLVASTAPGLFTQNASGAGAILNPDSREPCGDAGAAPFEVAGVMQINVDVPVGVLPGGAVPVVARLPIRPAK